MLLKIINFIITILLKKKTLRYYLIRKCNKQHTTKIEVFDTIGTISPIVT